jgi:hypothetical protein
MSKWVINGLAVAIIMVWVASMTTSFFVKGYNPPESVQWTISILAGAAFGRAAVAGVGIGNGNKPDQRP